jgi:hypothetical protein
VERLRWSVALPCARADFFGAGDVFRFGAGAALTARTAWEPVAAEDAFLRGLVAGGRMEAAALAAPAFALCGETGFFDFINECRKTSLP